MAHLQILVTATGPDNLQVSAPFTLIVLPASLSGTGLGLLGTYYNGDNYNTPSNSFCFDRIDPQVNFNWGYGSPGASVNSTCFSASWTGLVLAPVSGLYTFATSTDDQSALWVNGQQLFGWTQWGSSGSITLQAGQLYYLTMDFVQYYGSSGAGLYWSYPGQAQQLIPQSQLFGNPACMLSNTILADALPLGSTVATLLGTPGEAGVTLSNALVPGAGSDDNADFTINGTTLLSAAPIDSTVQSSYNIRVGTTDSNGLYSEFPFTLQIGPPPTVANAIPDQSVVVPNAFSYTVPAATFSDQEGAILYDTASLADGSPLPAWLSFDPSTSTFSGTPAATDVGTLQILVTADVPVYSPVSAPFTLTVLPPPNIGQGLGLLGAYYNGTSFNSFCYDEIDPQVNLYWGGNSPGANVGGDNWSAIWTGQVLAPQDGLYTFYTNTDDSAALWVNGQLLIDNWAGRNRAATPSLCRQGSSMI